MTTDPEGTEMTNDLDLATLKKLVDGTLDVVLRTQSFVHELMDRVVAVERWVNKMEKELEPQLVSLTQLSEQVARFQTDNLMLLERAKLAEKQVATLEAALTNITTWCEADPDDNVLKAISGSARTALGDMA